MYSQNGRLLPSKNIITFLSSFHQLMIPSEHLLCTLKNTVQKFFLFPAPLTYLDLFYFNSSFISVLTTYNALFSIYLNPTHPLRPMSSVSLTNPFQTTSGFNNFSFLQMYMQLINYWQHFFHCDIFLFCFTCLNK